MNIYMINLEGRDVMKEEEEEQVLIPSEKSDRTSDERLVKIFNELLKHNRSGDTIKAVTQ